MSKKEGKITLGMLKGKPVATSVPSIAIKFHANAEQIEELYGSDEETAVSEKCPTQSTTSINSVTSELESSPLKLFPRLVKRSTSIDIAPTNINESTSSSSPHDPWRFFSDIKGKITKSVEEKIIEIKTRNQDEGSPLKKNNNIQESKDKESKDNSSHSNSEENSESSISKTCGVVSTTEGVEMSSDDDDTPSLIKDENKTSFSVSPTSNLRKRFCFLRAKGTPLEGSIYSTTLDQLNAINTEKFEETFFDNNENDTIESGIDALEENNIYTDDVFHDINNSNIDNINVNNESVVVEEVEGKLFQTKRSGSVFAPTGFVDFRQKSKQIPKRINWSKIGFIIVFLIVTYLILNYFSPFLSGVTLGSSISLIICYFYISLNTINLNNTVTIPQKQIYEIPSVKEHGPLRKYEGWMNEYPDIYNPLTYQISQTQSVFLRLQGKLLRISHCKCKIPKRAMWNEPNINASFTHHRIYNLFGAKIELLPYGLTKTRLWSKKYPICITLNNDQMIFENSIFDNIFNIVDDVDEKVISETKNKKKGFSFGRKTQSKTHLSIISQRFSKLTEEEEELELESELSRPTTPLLDLLDENELINLNKQSKIKKNEEFISSNGDEGDIEDLNDEWTSLTQEECASETKLYLFGRTDREKEDWYRRLTSATKSVIDIKGNLTQIDNDYYNTRNLEIEYIKLMGLIGKLTQKSTENTNLSNDENNENSLNINLLWINTFIGRILFDCIHNDIFVLKIKERIDRKLAAIRLPYFIEHIFVTDLNLGQTTPIIHQASEPILNERGLWIDLNLTYDGFIVLTLQTKLNLMKLKQPPIFKTNIDSNEKSAMFHSDIDDSAESTSDEDLSIFSLSIDSSGNNTNVIGQQIINNSNTSSSNTSKKFIRMVDRITESKFFQAATENRYIKKAMEGVSNTDLRLKVELRQLNGILVLNIPPPPSDRVWIGFRPTPEICLSAHPIVGERNINFLTVTNWIEKKLLLEFQKLMVIPNMEDFIIPVMCSKLPE